MLPVRLQAGYTPQTSLPRYLATIHESARLVGETHQNWILLFKGNSSSKSGNTKSLSYIQLSASSRSFPDSQTRGIQSILSRTTQFQEPRLSTFDSQIINRKMCDVFKNTCSICSARRINKRTCAVAGCTKEYVEHTTDTCCQSKTSRSSWMLEQACTQNGQ